MPRLESPTVSPTADEGMADEDLRLPFARTESVCEHGVPDIFHAPVNTSIQLPKGRLRRETAQRASVDFGSRRRGSAVPVLDPPPPQRRRDSAEAPAMTWPPVDAHAPSTPSTPGPHPLMPSRPVTWASLPHKGQLAVLTLARLSEPLTQTSLQAYLYHQLASFSPDLPPAAIATQAGIVQASFAAAQAVTAILWGTVADQPWAGRKAVLTIGLCGTAMGSLGYGFSRSMGEAIFWRLVAGSLNGNVGVMRTMMSEIVKEKKYQSRAFLLLPMCFNVGVIIGPVLGGLLAEPAQSYPSLFGPGSSLGGKDGVGWMMRFPFALPNILSAFFLLTAAIGVIFNLQETHPALRDREDPGLRLAHHVISFFRRPFGRRNTHKYKYLPSSPSDDAEDSNSLLSPATPLTPLYPNQPSKKPAPARRLPFRRMWTHNVLATLLSHFLLVIGIGTFSSLWYIFLSTPRSTEPFAPPFAFAGGLGLPPSQVGAAMAVLGAIGITLQLAVYPPVAAALGTLRSYRAALALFPAVFALTPYLAVLPSTTAPPLPASGPGVWLPLATLLALYVLGRTFANPANVILINNCAPHPSVLSTIHGVAQSISGLARTVGPVAGGALFGAGQAAGVGGLAHWVLALVSVAGFAASWAVREGDGHELLLEGETRDGGDGEGLGMATVDEEDEEVSPMAAVQARVVERERRSVDASMWMNGQEEADERERRESVRARVAERERRSLGDASAWRDVREGGRA